MEYLQIIVQIAVSLAALIPLVIELVKYVQKAVKEKNWQSMVKIALDLMGEAEEKFSTGAERKEWVIAMVEKSAESINYELDTASLGTLIDNIIALTNKVNTDNASAVVSNTFYTDNDIFVSPNLVVRTILPPTLFYIEN